MKSPFTLFAASCALLLMAACHSRPTTYSTLKYYVSTKGSDSSGDGSMSRPWATIGYAATRAKAGATVYVAAGTYTGNVVTRTSGGSAAYITYAAAAADFSGPVDCAKLVANHGDTQNCARLVGVNDTAWVNFGNFTAIIGFDVTGTGINGIYTEGDATIIAGNHVHDILKSTCNETGGSGINLNGTNAQVTGNYVHHIGPFPNKCGYVQGIYFLKAGGSAHNNISFANSGFGIQLWHYPEHIALTNNTIFNNAEGGIVLGTNDNHVVDYVAVSNNIIANNKGPGVSEQGSYTSSTGTHNSYTHNLVYGNTGAAFELQNGLVATSTITSDPRFVNYTGSFSGDYHLQASSPAMGGATGTASPVNDFDGSARPQGGEYDAGSYEHVSEAPPTEPPPCNPCCTAVK
jgi:hypothetical protein